MGPPDTPRQLSGVPQFTSPPPDEETKDNQINGSPDAKGPRRMPTLGLLAPAHFSSIGSSPETTSAHGEQFPNTTASTESTVVASQQHQPAFAFEPTLNSVAEPLSQNADQDLPWFSDLRPLFDAKEKEPERRIPFRVTTHVQQRQWPDPFSWAVGMDTSSRAMEEIPQWAAPCAPWVTPDDMMPFSFNTSQPHRTSSDGSPSASPPESFFAVIQAPPSHSHESPTDQDSKGLVEDAAIPSLPDVADSQTVIHHDGPDTEENTIEGEALGGRKAVIMLIIASQRSLGANTTH